MNFVTLSAEFIQSFPIVPVILFMAKKKRKREVGEGRKEGREGGREEGRKEGKSLRKKFFSDLGSSSRSHIAFSCRMSFVPFNM